jgi:hypothetical protein
MTSPFSCPSVCGCDSHTTHHHVLPSGRRLFCTNSLPRKQALYRTAPHPSQEVLPTLLWHYPNTPADLQTRTLSPPRARQSPSLDMSPTKDSASISVLAERSPNTLSPTKSSSSTKTMLMDDNATLPRFEPPSQRTSTHTQDQSGGNHTYISPSDAIRSPTTKKLSEIKGKRFM